MKEFHAKVKFYIHNFQAMQDWFGNRGIEVQEGDINEWCYDGYFFYYTCNPSAPYEIQPEEGEKNCIACIFDSERFKPYEEMDYENSPFANKIADV